MSRLDSFVMEPEVLKELAVGYKNGALVYSELMPVVRTSALVGSIPEFGRESFVSFETQRALGAGPNQSRLAAYGSIPYKMVSHNKEILVDEVEIKAAAKVADLARKAITEAIAAIELSREISAATIATTAANFPTANKITYSDDYLNEVAVDPIAAMQTGCNAIENAVGIYPNRIFMDSKVWQFLRKNTKIADTYFPSNQSKLVTLEAVAELLGIEKIVVARGRKIETIASTTTVPIWGNNIVIAYVAAPQGDLAPSEYTPSFGYTIEDEAGRKDYSVANKQIMEYGSDLLTVPVITGASAGYLIKNPIDPALF